ncbi:hypothetical protein OHA72_09195 [Dactylosporangium sp. NBC_01737]|uniref:hypothetical protein n=1 Tax=Dactylosporangium sp. NBC_01737 TaxID=2975959 RepID=UPI002E11EBCB|nr:hypothetical protein OHA72_09195 [Dactylosporangium sp. NBC_01737]
MKRALGLLLAVTTVSLAGCAARSTDDAAAPPPSASAPGTPTPAPSGSKAVPSPGDSVITLPSGVPKTTAPHEPTDDFTVLTTTGQIRLEGACVELVTDKVVWLLIGPPAAGLRAGQRVKVTGLPDPGFESQCTGSPFKVTTVTPA